MLDLTGVEGMTALEWLMVRGRITDVSPLSGLSGLRYADLHGTSRIMDLSSLTLGTFPSAGDTVYIGNNELVEFFKVFIPTSFDPSQYPLVVERCGEDVADGPALRALVARGATLRVNPQPTIMCAITDLESPPDRRYRGQGLVDIYTDLFPCVICKVP